MRTTVFIVPLKMSLPISCLLFLIVVDCSFVLTVEAFNNVSVNKCCGVGQYYDEKGDECRKVAWELAADEPTWMVPGALLYDSEDELEFSWKYAGVHGCGASLKTASLWQNGSFKSADTSGAKYYFTKAGVLLEEAAELRGVTVYNHSVNYLPHQYCVDPLEDSVILRFCPKLCNKKEPCLQKCCPYGQHFEYIQYDEDTGYDTCVDSVGNGHNRKLNFTVDGQEVTTADESMGLRYISGGEYGVIDCVHQEVVKISTEFSGALIKKPFTFHVEDGRPFYFDKERKTWTEFENVENHCFERVITRTGDGDIGEDADVLFLCIHNRSSVSTSAFKYSAVWKTIYRVTLVIAILSLLLTTIVSLALIERQNLHTWTRAAYIISQLVFFTLIGLTYTSLSPVTYPALCKAFAIVLHFSALLTICWLSVINFDLWWTFRTLKPTGGQKVDVQRFALYSCFAFGVPSLVISIAMIIQSMKPDLDAVETARAKTWNFIYPDYGEAANQKCTLADKAVPAYWFGPLAILLVGNLIFFVTITMRMMHLRQITKRLPTQTSTGKYSFHIFVKIFIVSGITWNAEIIGWVFGNDQWHWVVLFHYAHAVALLIIFVCKREVIRNLQKRYPIFTKITPPLDSLHHSRPGTSGEGANQKSRKLSTTSTSGISTIPMTKIESYEMRPASLDLKCPPA